ncbi:MAG: RidA family protein [Chloroflexi bacterium]|jgi:enamine deaminase RidA (YjgF/YER057c/UK114 family)|nr:RidA family protein [Chloroflexota bacterium]
MTPEEKLRAKGIELITVERGDRPLVPWVRTGNLLFLSGAGPNWGGTVWRGQLGKEYTTQQGYEAARGCALNLLSAAKTALGELSRVRQVVKVLGMVNSAPGFSEQPQVVNGCSDLLVELFGEQGRHARSAVGMAGLPGGIPVEIEMILEVE